MNPTLIFNSAEILLIEENVKWHQISSRVPQSKARSTEEKNKSTKEIGMLIKIMFYLNLPTSNYLVSSLFRLQYFFQKSKNLQMRSKKYWRNASSLWKIHQFFIFHHSKESLTQ
jgi:hypothetical protein